MIELSDEELDYATIIGIGDLGVQVLSRLREKQRKDLKFCAVVSDKAQISRHESDFTIVCEGAIDTAGQQQSELHNTIQNSIMLVIVADVTDAFSAQMVSSIAESERNYEPFSRYYRKSWQHHSEHDNEIFSVALLKSANGINTQNDYIFNTRAICLQNEMLRQQCELQPEIFETELDFMAETATQILNLYLSEKLVGLDMADIRNSFSNPGKMTPCIGQGDTTEEAVDSLLSSATKICLNLSQCHLVIYSMSGARQKLSIFDVDEGLNLILKKIESQNMLFAAHVDDSLDDSRLIIFALFCERKIIKKLYDD